MTSLLGPTKAEQRRQPNAGRQGQQDQDDHDNDGPEPLLHGGLPLRVVLVAVGLVSGVDAVWVVEPHPTPPQLGDGTCRRVHKVGGEYRT